jgi:hypothetical protein
MRLPIFILSPLKGCVFMNLFKFVKWTLICFLLLIPLIFITVTLDYYYILLPGYTLSIGLPLIFILYLIKVLVPSWKMFKVRFDK